MASGIAAAALAKLGISVDWDTDNIDVLLVDDEYSFSAAHEFVDDVSASEVTATNYARQDVPTRSASESGGVGTYTAGNPEWTDLGNGTNDTIGGAWIFKATGSDATADLLFFIDTPDLLTVGRTTVLDLSAGVFSLQPV